MNKNYQSIPADGLGTVLSSKNDFANKALNVSTTFWFVLAVLGQGLFAYYVLVFYGGSAARGDMAQWDKQLEHGFASGDFMGNLMIVTHIALAFVITTGGPLQLIPKLRNRFRGFHRWNGRLYVIIAFVISFAGLYIITTRGVVGNWMMASGNIINAALIMLSAALTWRYAVARKMEAHRRWAIRLFLFVSGVWFIRVGFGLWIVLTGGPSGEVDYFEEPFFIFLIYAHTLFPVAIYEVYWRVKAYGGSTAKTAMAISLFVLTLLMAAGLVMVTMAFWWPHL